MPQQIVIAEQLRIAALLTDERIDELIVAKGRYQIGDVYLGTVENVLPGIDAAFVNIGESEKNGFIHVTDLGPLRLKKGASGITELLEPRQKVLVQVMKEPTGSKGPRLTGNLALPGRYLKLQPHGQGVNISRKINSEGERNRLRALGVLVKPPGSGLLLRTESEGISEDLLIDDLESLTRQWEAIQQASEAASPPILLNRDEDFIHRILRDHAKPDLTKVVVDTKSSIDRINGFLDKDNQNISVESYNGPHDILEHFRINAAIHDALRPRVDLPSGGYVIIEPTEALTVIDVNSGSFTRSANARETVLWTNCEAAIEIARQLKLRNIGGVIIIDFIDMESRRDQLQLLEYFTSAIKDDSARPQIAQLTELGLVELTRKRQGQNIYELFGKPCNICSGLGHIASLPTKDILEPQANATGIVKSTLGGKTEVQINNEVNNIKRKKGLKLKTNVENETPQDSSYTDQDLNPETNDSSQEATLPDISNNNRQEVELVPVEMTEEEQEVYSQLGLNPTLLLENTTERDNLIVRVVPTGEDADKILEECRNQLNTNNLRRRKKGRAIKTSTNSGLEEGNDFEVKEIDFDTKKFSDNEESAEELDIADKSNEFEITVNNDSQENIISSEAEAEKEEDPRRRRRRSSATE